MLQFAENADGLDAENTVDFTLWSHGDQFTWRRQT